MVLSLTRHLITSIFLLAMLAACVKTPNDNADCPFTINTVKILETKKHKGKVYYLVERISGWHEKVIIIQLFDEEPVLGKCNEDLVQPIFEDSIESETISKLIVNATHHKYELVYDDQITTKKKVEIEFIE